MRTCAIRVSVIEQPVAGREIEEASSQIRYSAAADIKFGSRLFDRIAVAASISLLGRVCGLRHIVGHRR